MDKEIKIWKPIEYNLGWANTDTSIFDDLAPSWYKKREEFKNSKSTYKSFIERLKREHSIETGVIENLYDLSEGITQTLIKDGFIDAYITKDDTNISPFKLMNHLSDHSNALDSIFSLVQNDRLLTKGFIKELHQCVTKNQESTEAIDSLGNIVEIQLLKGEFKKMDNNPKRKDGITYVYCPPVHVDTEIENLVGIYNFHVTQEGNPIILSAWLHHAFTQIHPFQDGNGRLARLLATLVLIKSGLLPFTVKRHQKSDYIKALEEADKGNPQILVTFFAKAQKNSIENAINFKEDDVSQSISDLTDIFNEKMDVKIRQKNEIKAKKRDINTKKVYSEVSEILEKSVKKFHNKIDISRAQIGMKKLESNNDDYYYFAHQIVNYAKSHNYFFNKDMDRTWGKIYFNLLNGVNYNLIITVHHYGYGNDVLAIGGFIEYTKVINDEEIEQEILPINLAPYTISIEDEINQNSLDNISSYLEHAISRAFSIVIQEIN